MSLFGPLSVVITASGGRITGIDWDLPRRLPLMPVFSGRTPDEAAGLVASLFPLCGNAQAVAAATALEAALGLDPGAAERRSRRMLVRTEAVREHVARVALDWPALIGEAGDPAAFAAAQRALVAVRAALYPAGAVRPGHAAAGAAGVGKAGAGTAPIVFPLLGVADAGAMATAFRDADGVEAWACAGASPAARLLARLLRGGNPGDVPDPAEGTVLARHADDGRVRAIAARHGELPARVLARLLELAALCDDRDGGDPATTGDPGAGPGRGQAEVEVARGTLDHRVAVEGGRIVDYGIEAPTLRHFGPGRVADVALRRIRAADVADLEWQARLTVLEIDPCVGFSMEFRDGKA